VELQKDKKFKQKSIIKYKENMVKGKKKRERERERE